MQPEPITAETHPSFADPIYRERRDRLAALAQRREPARIEYTTDEHATWQRVRARIDPLHRRHACAQVLAAQERVPLGTERIPQLADVSAMLAHASGFRLAPVAGLVAPRPFFASLARGTFLATQYVRHPSSPLYTPEPDVIHELVGHAATLVHPGIAEVNRLLGEAAAVADEVEMVRIERVYWYTLEFGLVEERGQLKAYGAGLLSSVGELAGYQQTARIAPWDLDEIGRTPYDPTSYQAVLFAAPSFTRMLVDVAAWTREGGWRSP
jgi:phenylalanine-4-hydroxylase